MNLDRVATLASQFASQRPPPSAPANRRDYVVGAAGFQAGYDTYGADPADYAPEFFGNYLLTSNPVFSVVTQRASWLASLPVRLYQYTEGQSSKVILPRNNPSGTEVLRAILGKLEQAGVRDSVRNAAAVLHAARSRPALHHATRSLGMEEVFGGPAYDLLQFINPYWTLNRLNRMVSMCLDIWGQAYIFAERGNSGTGDPKELWWAKPTQVRVLTDKKRYIGGYIYTPISGGEELLFRPSEVIRIYYPNPLDEFQPLPPLASSRIYADHESASMQANMRLHQQGLHPGAIVMPEDKNLTWSEEQARDVETDINNRLGGVDKAHRWGVFRHLVKIDRSGITPKDAEYIEGMSYDVEAIARAYDWPIDLLSGKRTYENVEQAFRRAWQSVIINAVFIAAELAEQLLPMFSNPGADVPLFDGTGVAVLQESEKTRWEIEKDQIHKVITVNEWRASRGLEAKEGGDGLFVSNQLTPLDNPSFVTGIPDEGKPEAETEMGEEEPVQIDLSNEEVLA